MVRAVYDFEPENANELPFRRDDILVLTRRDAGDGWSEGERDGRVGLFPSNYIRLVSRAPSVHPVRPAAAATASPQAQRMCSHRAGATPGDGRGPRGGSGRRRRGR
jgi:hypothetical protein